MRCQGTILNIASPCSVPCVHMNGILSRYYQPRRQIDVPLGQATRKLQSLYEEEELRRDHFSVYRSSGAQLRLRVSNADAEGRH